MKRRLVKDVVDIELVKFMLAQGKSWTAIGIHYGFEPNRLRRYCHQHGIYVRGPYKKEETG